MPDKLLIESTGLTSSDLSMATALPTDVISGKTFYAGDKSLKTGSFNLGSANATPDKVLNGASFYSNGNKGLQWGTIWPYESQTWASADPIADGANFRIPFPVGAYLNKADSGYPEILVTGQAIQAKYKTASFNLSLFSGGVAYGEVLEKWWSPGGTVIGMTKCKIRTDTESGEPCANETYCEISNGQVHFVTNYTHRGGWTYAEGTVVFI